MKTWRAVAILTAARLGTSPEEFVPMLPQYEESTKKAMRMSGISHQAIEQEYPERILSSALLLIELDPEEFERQFQKSIEQFVSRN